MTPLTELEEVIKIDGVVNNNWMNDMNMIEGNLRYFEKLTIMENNNGKIMVPIVVCLMKWL